jgi:4-aminobutyrate aminotransferase-like enzyme/Ser/Thr protein kinase RdoA (MazF antagonist)
MSIIKDLPPNFKSKEVVDIIKNKYGYDSNVKPLVSDIGQNFLVSIQDNRQFIFKIANPSEKYPVLEAQNQVMEILLNAKSDYQFPMIIPDLQNQNIIKIKSSENIEFNARMLTFLPGQFLAESKKHSPKMLKSLGRMLGKMDLALKDFEHPALDRYWHWDLKNVTDLQKYLSYIKDARIRNLADYWLLQFEAQVLSMIPDLRISVIHHDANDHNILVNNDSEIYGLIDFGDMVNSCTIFELGVALAYVMLNQKSPLESTIPVVQGYHEVFPLTEKEIDILFYCAMARLTSSIIIAAYQNHLRPDNEYLSITASPAQKILIKMQSANPLLFSQKYKKICQINQSKSSGFVSKKILKVREKHLGKSLSVSYNKPIKIVRGAAQYLFDENGKTYLDCVNNVTHVGHCHPKIVRAANSQMSSLNTNTRYLHDNIANYAQRLSDLMPDPLNVCFFVNSGSEANELALRLARTYTNQKDCIVLDHAYHGNTTAVVEISPYKFDGPGGKGPEPFIHKVPLPDTYRGSIKSDEINAGKKYADFLIEPINKIKENNKKPAALIFESLPGVAGQIVFPDNYLKHAFEYARKAGAVCIADEVQIGFGRIGSHFWGFQTQNVVPEIVTLGKPIGNGHPLAAVITTKEIADAFANGMEYFNTFGGNPVSCAIGMAVLDVIQEEELQQHALETGIYFLNQLEKLKSKHKLIGDVRGMGLFIGVELVTNHDTLRPAVKESAFIAEEMKNKGILISIDGPLNNVIKIKPPLVFNKENVDHVAINLDKILSGMN